MDSKNHCKKREECGRFQKTAFMYQHSTFVRSILNRLSWFQFPWLPLLHRSSDQMCGTSIKCRDIGNSIFYFFANWKYRWHQDCLPVILYGHPVRCKSKATFVWSIQNYIKEASLRILDNSHCSKWEYSLNLLIIGKNIEWLWKKTCFIVLIVYNRQE